ncbi:hypothetical protein RvY_17769 [Ramazzottius varieornatus]|uniref:Uncharacterized protein n=1 Tax=Ramazzottius varieornatus TaxID=947166 RepID=A0A1D1W3B3_RAMVA|nr:hypothetical protein RvY_17769 [Ramazzottius varieornatus]
MLQRFRAGRSSFQSYHNIEDDQEKLPKGRRDLVEHLLWALYNHEKKYLRQQPLAFSVLGTLKSLEGDARAETLLNEAASISQKDFDDAYTVPYSFLVNHYIRVGGGTGNPLAKSPEEIRMQRVALVPRPMIARAVSRFQLCIIRDEYLLQG